MNDKLLGTVVIVGEKGSVYQEAVYDERDLLWEALLGCWPHAEKDGVTYIYIPQTAAKFRKATPMACLYSAVDSYMGSLLGRKMDNADRNFFDDHPLTGSSGVSQPNTLRVVYDLTTPYGVCVSRVRAWPGTMISGDLAQWINVLGMNPLGMVNRQTSNREFCETTGLPLEDADRMFRFEFSKEPLRPAISCGTYVEDGKNGKKAVGHASYESPRAHNADSILQFQLTHREKINWEKEPVFEPVQTDGDASLSLYETLDPDGKPMYHRIKSKRGSLPASSSKETRMVGQPALGPVGLTTHKRTIRTCYLCYSETGDRIGANLCIRCWALFLKDIACGECGQVMTATSFTSPLSGLSRKGKDWYLYVKCGWCMEKNELICLPGTVANAIQKAIRGEDDGVITQQYPARTPD